MSFIIFFVGVLIEAVLTFAAIMAFAMVVIYLLAKLLDVYDAITQTGWYKKTMVLIRLKTGKLKAVVIVLDEGGNLTWEDVGDLDERDIPDDIVNELNRAEREKSLVNEDPAVAWRPEEKEKKDVRTRNSRGY
jgi:hypothetical protein